MPEIDAAALLKRRQQSLLVKWAAGKRLTAEENAEVAAILPKPPPTFELQAQVEGENKKPYKKKRGEYAEEFGQSVRSINRWMNRGAPLDAPEKMAAWWAGSMKQKVPDNLLEMARRKSDDVSLATSPAATGVPYVADGITMSPVEQARLILEQAFSKLQSAQAGEDPGRLALAQRAYKDALEQLRKAELAAPKINAAAGSVVNREVVRTALTRIHTSMAAAIRSFAKRVGREVLGKPPAEQDVYWQSECDKLFKHFRDCEFSDFA